MAKTWQNAHVGRTGPQVAVRVTEEEKDRLEQLRRELRLTSKGQVIRAALDVLERIAVVGAALGISNEGEDWHKVVTDINRGAGRLHARNHDRNVVGGEPGADAGLPGTAPAVSDQDEQLELPDMPAREALA